MSFSFPFGGWQSLIISSSLFCGALFYFLQNRFFYPTGGKILFIKSLWLFYVITLWLVTPLVIGLTFNENPLTQRIFLVLGISTLLRGLIELYLCYVTKSWKTRYGKSHNGLQFAISLGGLFLVLGARQPWWAPGTLLLILISLSIICETAFVFLFEKATSGPEKDVYFVPPDEASTRVKRLTHWVLWPQLFFFTLVIAG